MNENKKLSPRQLLEKKAWQLIGEMDKYKREMLIEGFESDKNKWEDFLERIKYHKFINSTLVAEYIIYKTFNHKYKKKYLWEYK